MKNKMIAIAKDELNYLVEKLNKTGKAKYRDLLFEFRKGEAWAREKPHYLLYIFTDGGNKQIYDDMISKNSLKSVLKNWFKSATEQKYYETGGFIKCPYCISSEK